MRISGRRLYPTIALLNVRHSRSVVRIGAASGICELAQTAQGRRAPPGGLVMSDQSAGQGCAAGLLPVVEESAGCLLAAGMIIGGCLSLLCWRSDRRAGGKFPRSGPGGEVVAGRRLTWPGHDGGCQVFLCRCLPVTGPVPHS